MHNININRLTIKQFIKLIIVNYRSYKIKQFQNLKKSIIIKWNYYKKNPHFS